MRLLVTADLAFGSRSGSSVFKSGRQWTNPIFLNRAEFGAHHKTWATGVAVAGVGGKANEPTLLAKLDRGQIWS